MNGTGGRRTPAGGRPCAACGSAEHHRLQCSRDEPRRREALRTVRTALDAVSHGASAAAERLAALAGSAGHAADRLVEGDADGGAAAERRREERLAQSSRTRVVARGNATDDDVRRLRHAVDLLGEELVDARARVAVLAAELDEARADGVIADAMVAGYAAEVHDLREVVQDYERTVDLLLDEVVRRDRVREG